MTKRITATSDAGMYYDIYIRRPRKLDHGVLDFNVFWGRGASVNITVPLRLEPDAYCHDDDVRIRNSATTATNRIRDWYPHFNVPVMALPKRLLDNIYKELEEYFTKELKRFKKERKLNKEN